MPKDKTEPDLDQSLMSDWALTLLEYHSHDGGIEFFSKEGEEAASETDTSGTGNRAIAVLIGLVLSVAITIAVYYLRAYRQSDGEDNFEQISVTEFED